MPSRLSYAHTRNSCRPFFDSQPSLVSRFGRLLLVVLLVQDALAHVVRNHGADTAHDVGLPAERDDQLAAGATPRPPAPPPLLRTFCDPQMDVILTSALGPFLSRGLGADPAGGAAYERFKGARLARIEGTERRVRANMIEWRWAATVDVSGRKGEKGKAKTLSCEGQQENVLWPNEVERARLRLLVGRCTVRYTARQRRARASQPGLADPILLFDALAKRRAPSPHLSVHSTDTRSE